MSCLFESLAKLRPPTTPKALRRQCVDFVKDATVHNVRLAQWAQWETGESEEQYLARMQDSAQWGGGIELAAAANVLQCQIAVHLVGAAGSGCAAEFMPTDNLPQARLNLLYNGGHYEPSHASKPATAS